MDGVTFLQIKCCGRLILHITHERFPPNSPDIFEFKLMISAHIYEENAEAAGAAQEFQCESLVVPIAAAICTCRSVKALAKKR